MPNYKGTWRNDTVNGGAGNDTLFGDQGNDLLKGGLGNDVYRFVPGTGRDTVVDSGGVSDMLLLEGTSALSRLSIQRQGDDLVFDFDTLGKVTLQGQFAGSAGHVELVKLAEGGLGPLTIQTGVVGGLGDDLIVGTDGSESIVGGAGNDLVWAGDGDDTVLGGAGVNVLRGGQGNDSLVAGVEGDDLFGGAGSDVLVGGRGWDTAHMENLRAGVFANFSGTQQTYLGTVVKADQVLETSSGDTDQLRSIEAFVGTSYADYVVLGRTGRATSVVLGEGNDTVAGGAANSDDAWADIRYWDNLGAVIVNTGSQALTVNLGGTLHTVAGFSARDAWGGTDTFLSSGRGFSLTGSNYGDYIRGQDDTSFDAIHDCLDGYKGNDTLDGGSGTDIAEYDWEGTVGVVVNLSSSAITASVDGAWVRVGAGKARDNWGGTDTLLNIENVVGGSRSDYIVGSAGDNPYLTGGAGNDTIQGGDGNDALSGGAGQDWLYGGAGRDAFVFDTAPNAATNVDRLVDFDSRADMIVLDSAVMPDLGAVGPLSAAAFRSAPGATQAADSSDRVIYDSNSGALYYDADGSGSAMAPVQIAILGSGASHPALYSSLIYVI